eukprot:2931858-Prymnesium_polylepis.1
MSSEGMCGRKSFPTKKQRKTKSSITRSSEKPPRTPLRTVAVWCGVARAVWRGAHVRESGGHRRRPPPPTARRARLAAHGSPPTAIVSPPCSLRAPP